MYVYIYIQYIHVTVGITHMYRDRARLRYLTVKLI